MVTRLARHGMDGWSKMWKSLIDKKYNFVDKFTYKVTIYRMENGEMILSHAFPIKTYKTELGANKYAEKALKSLAA